MRTNIRLIKKSGLFYIQELKRLWFWKYWKTIQIATGSEDNFDNGYYVIEQEKACFSRFDIAKSMFDSIQANPVIEYRGYKLFPVFIDAVYKYSPVMVRYYCKGQMEKDCEGGININKTLYALSDIPSWKQYINNLIDKKKNRNKVEVLIEVIGEKKTLNRELLSIELNK